MLRVAVSLLAGGINEVSLAVGKNIKPAVLRIPSKKDRIRILPLKKPDPDPTLEKKMRVHYI